ncbi:hypothetical protein [Streptomyces sp. NPDC018352]|uniref:hypothetical protein n=1 Tax=Streptomyces sp. NPDC018352 TaxID=3157194 RepID=UPI0033C7FDB2
MSGQEAAQLPPEEEHAEPVRLRLVKTATEQQAPAPEGRERLDLRAYLPTPRNLRVLLAGAGEGTGVLLGHGWAWLRGEGWDGDSALKAGGVAFVAYAAGSAVLSSLGTYAGYLIPPAVVAWCLVARQHTDLAVAVRTAVKEAKEAEKQRLLVEARKEIAATATQEAERRVGRAAPTEVPADTGDTADTDPEPVAPAAADPADDDDGLTVDDVARIIRRVAALHTRHLGVHLSDLLLQPELEGWEQTDLKAALQDDWGLPVSSFKLTFPSGPARTREGVRLEHLPQAPEAPAGQAGGRVPGEAPQGAPAGVGEGLALVPSQHPAGHRPGTPVTGPPGARPGTPSGAGGGVLLSPSPTSTPAPSQGIG